MAWKRKVAHQITRGYLKRRYNIPSDFLLSDPQISALPFYNPEVSPELRRNEMRIVAGRLLRFFSDLNLDLETDGRLDSTFDELVELLTDGQAATSELAVKIDACFKFIDEE